MVGITALAEPSGASGELDPKCEGGVAKEVPDEEALMACVNKLNPLVTPGEERKLVRKIDFRFLPFILALYMCTWLDRGALGNAALMGIREDLPLSSHQFSLAVSMFFVGTCIANLFTNICMRYIRPSLYLAGAMTIWGVLETLQAVAGSESGLYAFRFLIGILQSAVISGAPYMTTIFYPRAEWGSRVAVFLSATPLAGAFGGWIAYGVSRIDTLSKVRNWQMLFILQGLLTLVFGILCIWVLPDRPHNTKWLSPRERDVADWRMLKDGNRTHGKVHWNVVGRQLIDWRLWINIYIFMGQVISVFTITTFAPIIVATMGYDNLHAQLMTAQPYCVAFVMVYVVGHLSDRLKSCSGLLVINSIIAATGYLMLVLVPVEHHQIRYGATFLVLPGILSGVTLTVGNIASNCCGDIKKGIATGLFQSFGSTMGIVSGYLFPPADRPQFTKGFRTLLGATLFTGVGAAVVTILNRRENARRDRLHGKPLTHIVIDFDEDGLMEQHPYWRYYL